MVENCGCVPDRPRFGLVLRPGRRRRPEAGQGVRHEALAAAAGGGGACVVGRRGGLRRPVGRVVVDGGCLPLVAALQGRRDGYMFCGDMMQFC